MRSAHISIFFSLLVCALLCSQGAYSVVALPGSGVVGDEYGHYRLDSGHSSLTHAQRIAAVRRSPQAVKSTFPLRGDVRSVVILVEYKDVPFTVADPQGAFYRLLNEEGYAENGGTGSAADYFRACSYNTFRPTFDVYGPYTLPHERSYYGANDTYGNDKNARQMIIDACQMADDDGVDFKQYDLNNDGNIDNVFVYYAGTNPAEGGPESAIWPHRSAVWGNVRIDGKTLYDYACTSELTLTTSKNGTMCGIGTFCHEFGHVLGLPDLYDTDDSQAYTVGSWDIMCSGNYNNNGRTPPAYSAFERFALGWLTPTQLSSTADYILSPLNEEPTAYLIARSEHNLIHISANPSEYWLIENRQHTGWDTPESAIPGVGLLITHINHNAGRWGDNTYNNYSPLGYDICEAYNKQAVRSTATDTYPGSVGITSFVPTQSNGIALTDMQVMNIRYLTDKDITFHYGEQDDRGVHFVPTALPTLQNYVLNNRIDPQSEALTLKGKELTSDRIYCISSNNSFSVSTDNTTWHTDTLWIPLQADSIETTIYVRYTGTRACREQTASLFAGTADNVYRNQLAIVGYAERPTLITDIAYLPADTSSPYSFTARWEEQADAETYYLTLCKWRDEPNEITQDFESFVTWEKIAETGWSTTFLRTTTTSYDGKTALLLNMVGDAVTTERYLSPVSRVSFWLSQSFIATSSNVGATLLFEGSSVEGAWETIAQIAVTPLTQTTVRHYELGSETNYSQFRITCTQIEGAGGCIIDGFSVVMPRTFEYVYRNDDYPIYAPADSIFVAGLQPLTTYSYQIVCSETKGCERHTSALGIPQFITTPAGETTESGKMTVFVLDDEVRIYACTLFDATSVLYIYDINGRLVTTAIPNPESDACVLPMRLFERGKQYLVKLVHRGTSGTSMKRKQPYGKIYIPK